MCAAAGYQHLQKSISPARPDTKVASRLIAAAPRCGPGRKVLRRRDRSFPEGRSVCSGGHDTEEDHEQAPVLGHDVPGRLHRRRWWRHVMVERSARRVERPGDQ